MKTSHLITVVSSILLGTFLQSCSQVEYKSDVNSVPSQLISVEQGVSMKSEYDAKIAPLIKASKQGDYDPTEFAYIELDSLKKYIAFLESVEKLNNKKISGLRIYYAAYPTTNTGTSKMKHPGRETFFFAPTMEQSGGTLSDEQKQFSYLRNVPFSIIPKDGSNKFVGNFRPIEKLLFGKDVKINTQNASVNQAGGNASSDFAETSLLLNELNICPPPKKP